MVTEGEAEAARNCSSRLGVSTADGADFEEDFNGGWNGKVDGSGGSVGQGRVASLKCRPLQTRAGQWNEATTTSSQSGCDQQTKLLSVQHGIESYFARSF